MQIFLILWFWYGFLTIFGISRLIYRIIQCSSSQLRYFIIRMHIHRYFHAHGHMRHVEHYIKKCSYGDWFVLYQMSRNMNRRFFAEFLTLLRYVQCWNFSSSSVRFWWILFLVFQLRSESLKWIRIAILVSENWSIWEMKNTVVKFQDFCSHSDFSWNQFWSSEIAIFLCFRLWILLIF